MKRKAPFTILFFVLLIIALVFTATDQAYKNRETAVNTPWLPPELTPEASKPASTPGWWDELPTAVPFPSPTPRK
jgi:hypothetical protein